MAPPAAGGASGTGLSGHQNTNNTNIVTRPQNEGVTLVLDNGADRMKMGFAGDPAPRFYIPNCMAKLKGQLQVRRGLVVFYM
jgi:hypothetical protein